jgi:hypothetical protein
LAIRFELSSSNIFYEDINNLEWVDKLCKENKFTQALNISCLADKRNEMDKRFEVNTISKSCLQQTISNLSKRVAIYQWMDVLNSNNSKNESYIDLFKNLVYGSPITRSADPLCMYNSDLLTYHLDIISHLDSSSSQLSLHKNTCFEIASCGENETKLKLPAKLVLSYCGSSISCGLPSENNTGKSFINGNPNDLIRLLFDRFLKYAKDDDEDDIDIMTNYLIAAMDISCRLVDIVDDYTGKNNENLLPYQLFDELFISCDFLLNKSVVHNINLKMLLESKIRLSSLIEKHFKRMIVNELL